MENTMRGSLSSNAALLAFIVLMCAGSLSARTVRTFVPIPGPATRINAATSVINQTQILIVWASTIYTDGDYGV